VLSGLSKEKKGSIDVSGLDEFEELGDLPLTINNNEGKNIK
jgi:hypothetical protein